MCVYAGQLSTSICVCMNLGMSDRAGNEAVYGVTGMPCMNQVCKLCSHIYIQGTVFTQEMFNGKQGATAHSISPGGEHV